MSQPRRFLVIGLGSFGTALAKRLMHNGCRVTGLDASKERVEELKDVLYEAIIGNATERETLEHLSVADFDTVFISLGEDITQSLLATLHVKELGSSRIVVKGVTPEHGKLLKFLGVERVVFPEVEMAETLADRVTWTNILDYVPLDPNYSFVEVAVPDAFVGKTLSELNLRRRFGVWVVGVKDVLTSKLTMFPGGDFTIGADQLLLVVGKQDEIKKLSEVS